MFGGKTVVLLVDRDTFWHENLRKQLKGHPFEVLSAYDAQSALRIFVDNPDINVVAVDHCVSGVELDALELVAEIRRGFSGQMIASCTNCNRQDRLVEAGCDTKVYKSHLANLLLEQLAAQAAAV